MPSHALEIFNEIYKVEIYHHINQFEINPFYCEEVQFHIQRGVHSIETKAVNCLLIFEKQFTDCTKINLDMRASGQCSVLWAPSRTTRVLVLAGERRCALEKALAGKKKCELRFQAWLNLHIITKKYNFIFRKEFIRQKRRR